MGYILLYFVEDTRKATYCWSYKQPSTATKHFTKDATLSIHQALRLSIPPSKATLTIHRAQWPSCSVKGKGMGRGIVRKGNKRAFMLQHPQNTLYSIHYYCCMYLIMCVIVGASTTFRESEHGPSVYNVVPSNKQEIEVHVRSRFASGWYCCWCCKGWSQSVSYNVFPTMKRGTCWSAQPPKTFSRRNASATRNLYSNLIIE